ncbi:MAG: SOS response-associated peptidase [Sphingomonas sp.]
MCNLYSIKTDPSSYFDALEAMADPANTLAVEKDYAAPGKPGFVVRQEGGQRVLSTMRWGFPTRKPRKRLAREGELPFLYDWWTNARNMQSNMWKPWLLKAEHRCLVPFTRFAEPKAVADRQEPGDNNWWFTVADQETPCFAGLWKFDQDHDRVYAFCTTEPNPLVAPKHPKAMPVILLAEDQGRWLTAPVEEAVGLLTAYPSQLMGVS